MRSWMRLDSPAAVRILRKRDLQRVHLQVAAMEHQVGKSTSSLHAVRGEVDS